MHARADAQWLSQAVRGLYAARTTEELSAAGIGALRGRFRVTSAALEQVAYDGSRYRAHALYSQIPAPPDYMAYLHDHPIFPLMRPRPQLLTLHLREITTESSWSRTDHYNGVARRVGYSDQMAVLACAEQDFLALAVYRDTLFDADEVDLISLLQPHLHAAWHRVRSDGTVYTAVGSPLLVDRAFRIRDGTPAQDCLLRAYFPRWRDARSLPPEARTWLAAQIEGLAATPARPLRVFRAETARGILHLRYFPQATPEPEVGHTVHIVEVPARPDFFALQHSGLTSRECEVLHWIALGKRDAEIATILGCAPRTVGKHIEHLLPKLGTATRQRAVHAARQRLQPHG